MSRKPTLGSCKRLVATGLAATSLMATLAVSAAPAQASEVATRSAATSAAPLTVNAWGAWVIDYRHFPNYAAASTAITAFVQFMYSIGYRNAFDTELYTTHEWVGGAFVLVYGFKWRYWG